MESMVRFDHNATVGEKIKRIMDAAEDEILAIEAPYPVLQTHSLCPRTGQIN